MSKKSCGCGAPMYEIRDTSTFECLHCDGVCHARCEADSCDDPKRDKHCHQCKALDRATIRRAHETRPL